MTSASSPNSPQVFSQQLLQRAKSYFDAGDEIIASCLVRVLNEFDSSNTEIAELRLKISKEIGLNYLPGEVRDLGSSKPPIPRAQSIASRTQAQLVTLIQLAAEAVEANSPRFAQDIIAYLIDMGTPIPPGVYWILSTAFAQQGQGLEALKTSIAELNVAPHQFAKVFVSDFVEHQRREIVNSIVAGDIENAKAILLFFGIVAEKHSIRWANFICGECCLKMGLTAEATEAFEKEANVNPNNEEVLRRVREIGSSSNV